MNLIKTHQYVAGAVLMLLMILTRSSHTATAIDLPDASWAVFFLGGFYLMSVRLFPLFMLVAWLTDLGAVSVGGVDDSCLTPAYFALVPAYGALWLAGMWYGHVHRDRLSTLLPLLGIFLVGVGLCEIFSSGGFYVFSGSFQSLSWTEYAQRTVKYFPSFVSSALMYLLVAVCVHFFVRAYVRGPRRTHLENPGG